ncbi:MAG: AAA family ATPase [Actinomycetota bacterium]
MADTNAAAGPGVIVVAEERVHSLLANADITWNVQERQQGVASMWQGLSSGALDQRSRILIFSDSLLVGTANDDRERRQTAQALVMMAKAGAVAGIVQWREESWHEFEGLIAEEAASQGVDVGDLEYSVFPAHHGGRELLETLRERAGSFTTFPDEYPDAVDEPLVEEVDDADDASIDDGISLPLAPPEPDAQPDAPLLPGAPPSLDDAGSNSLDAEAEVDEPDEPTKMPSLPGAPTLKLNMGGAKAPASAPEEPAVDSEYPPNADLELLGKPKLPGQITFTVTSSKGGSGKSTVSLLLASTIARASAQAGKPLSVCVIDLDVRDGQVASLIGKFMPTALNIRVQPVWDEERIRRNMVAAEGLNVDTLLAPIRPRTADTVGPEFYRTIVRSLQRMYDVVIIDTSVQYLEPLIAEVALVESDAILFVTTLASTAIQGMARALREITAPLDESGLGIPRSKVGIVVNQSVANVGMEREQVQAAGLGVPVVGVVPLATKDVLTATNLNKMGVLLDHPLLGPAYLDLVQACLPGRDLQQWDPSTDPLAKELGLSGASSD